MAVYKVPQDVEADDKLIGPFSFRQFIYLIIAVLGIALAWGLAQLFIGLALIPLPIVIFFGALALPLRKDQPMEIYLAAVVSFYLKPRRRLWQPDGIQSLIEITAPKEVEVHRTKELSQTEAQQRLSYLADIVDTGGWAIRGVSMPDPNSPMRGDAYFEAQQTQDILDEKGGVAQSFDSMITQADAKRRQEMIERMRQPPTVPIATPQPTQPAPIAIADPYAELKPPTPETSSPEQIVDPEVTFNPYPNAIHQTIINPIGTALPTQPQSTNQPPQPEVIPQIQQQNSPAPTSEKVISPDIINLANNSDLSIETIAHEANRIHQKEEKLPEDEVVISLR